MTIKDYIKAERAAAEAAAAVRGCRKQRKAAAAAVIEWTRRNASTRTPGAAFVVVARTENLGSKKWPDCHTAPTVEKIEGWKETERCFVSLSGKSRVLKSSIIGWLAS